MDELKNDSEEKIKSKSEQQADKIKTKNELLQALHQDFATSLTKVYINSLKKEIGFKEITVLEQKNLSRIMIANENRKDIIYDAQCALINKLCLAENFDIYVLTEFDRIKLLIALYQANMFKNEIKFTCEVCGAENSYTLDFDEVLRKLDQVEIVPKQFEYENKNFKYSFVLAYPNVRRVSKQYEIYVKRNRLKRGTDVSDLMSLMEYSNLYLVSLEMENKETKKKLNLEFSDYSVEDTMDIISNLPQDLFYSEKGILSFVMSSFIQIINDAFEKHVCPMCGAEVKNEDVNSARSFF